MKKLLITLSCLLLFSSVALASPQMDFSAGSGSIDLTGRDTENTLTVDSESYDFDKKFNFDGTVTAGLGNDFALQYRNFVPKSKDTNIEGIIYTSKIRTNEYNLLYKLDTNVAALAGMVNAKGSLQANNLGSRETNSKNYWQVGIIASTVVAPNTTLWGSAAAGENLTNYEVGAAYEFSPGWEFDVNYRNIKLKNFDIENVNPDLKASGFGLGVTYKF
jgi:opacity protein-like surface antigen